jgi:hypothetical protein
MLTIDVIKSIACLSELYETEEEKYNFQYNFFTKIVNKEVRKINESLMN